MTLESRESTARSRFIKDRVGAELTRKEVWGDTVPLGWKLCLSSMLSAVPGAPWALDKYFLSGLLTQQRARILARFPSLETRDGWLLGSVTRSKSGLNSALPLEKRKRSQFAPL